MATPSALARRHLHARHMPLLGVRLLSGQVLVVVGLILRVTSPGPTRESMHCVQVNRSRIFHHMELGLHSSLVPGGTRSSESIGVSVQQLDRSSMVHMGLWLLVDPSLTELLLARCG